MVPVFSLVQKVAPNMVKILGTMKAADSPTLNSNMEFSPFFGGDGKSNGPGPAEFSNRPWS